MEEIPRGLIRAIERHALEAEEGRDWAVGTLEVNDFSACFQMLPTDRRGAGLYVKIPKHDLYLQDTPELFPLTSDDLRMGQGEFESLRCLEEYWGKDMDGAAPFVRAVGYEPDYNAIITKRVVGQDAYPMLFKWASTAAKGNSKAVARFVDVLRSIARPLAMFHGHFAEETPIDYDSIIEKMNIIRSKLEAVGIDNRFLKKTMDHLNNIEHIKDPATRTQTLKGLDIRNIHWASTSTPVLLDPGALKSDWAEADLARFLVTLKLLFWGSFRFLGGTAPLPSFEAAFLESYLGVRNAFNPRLLNTLTIKELFKHWRMAYVAGSNKGWPSHIERMVTRWYVDPFYKSQISIQLSALTK